MHSLQLNNFLLHRLHFTDQMQNLLKYFLPQQLKQVLPLQPISLQLYLLHLEYCLHRMLNWILSSQQQHLCLMRSFDIWNQCSRKYLQFLCLFRKYTYLQLMPIRILPTQCKLLDVFLLHSLLQNLHKQHSLRSLCRLLLHHFRQQLVSSLWQRPAILHFLYGKWNMSWLLTKLLSQYLIKYMQYLRTKSI